jgi:endonuclease/exonuclease/phosphatase family metal-dependent hydrolase
MLKFSLNWILFLSLLKGSTLENVQNFLKDPSLWRSKLLEEQVEKIDSFLHQEKRIRILSYNILLSQLDKAHSLEHSWEKRKERILTLINEHDPDVLLIQEASDLQKTWLKNRLESTHLIYENKTPLFENLPIFLKKGRFEVLDEKRHVVHASERIVFLELVDLVSAQKWAIVNIHPNFANMQKRHHVVDQALNWIETKNLTDYTLIGGDMNAFDPYIENVNLPFYDGAFLNQRFLKKGVFPLKDRVLLGYFGPLSSFTNRSMTDLTPFSGEGTPGILLDRFYSGKKILPLYFAVERGKVDGQYPSDHLPIFTEIIVADEAD